MTNSDNSHIDNGKRDQFVSDMNDYKQKIVDALLDRENNKNKVFDNDDNSKNAMIMSAMFDNCDEITMFCGEMSILREGFYKDIDNKCEGAGDQIKGIVTESLDKFIEVKTNKLNILLENFDKSYLNDLISDKIKAASNINISKVNTNLLLAPVLSHTTLGMKDNKIIIRRRETNRRNRTARCMVNLGEQTESDSISLMSNIKNVSYPIEL